MRIAVVTTSYPAFEGDPSGHFVQADVRALEREGHQVSVVSPLTRGPFGWPGAAFHLRKRPWEAIRALAWMRTARARLAALGPDRIVCHWVVPTVIPIAAGMKASARVEGVSHGGDVRLLLALPSPVRHALVHSLLSTLSAWRFVSQPLRDSLTDHLPSDMASAVVRISVVRPSAIELPDVGTLTEACRAAGPYVAMVGRLVPSKRFDRAIDHVARRAGNSRVVVVGDGPERARLEAHAKVRGVDARFLGRLPRQEALAWIGAAEALVFASEAEGLSTVVREAEALGVRVEWVSST